MLAERLERHSATAWLLNTGWVGGAKGKRCPLKYTRAIVDAERKAGFTHSHNDDVNWDVFNPEITAAAARTEL